MKYKFSVVAPVVVGAAIAASAAWAATAPKPAATPAPATHTIVDMKDVKWGPPPPALPPGAALAVLAGDPAAAGFVSLRAKMPKGYKVPPHFHPTDEHVTVLSGAMAFGMSDKIDAKTETTIKPGGYFTAGANMHHYAIAKEATVIQVDLIGPFEITYLNPADDPRKKGK